MSAHMQPQISEYRRSALETSRYLRDRASDAQKVSYALHVMRSALPRNDKQAVKMRKIIRLQIELQLEMARDEAA